MIHHRNKLDPLKYFPVEFFIKAHLSPKNFPQNVTIMDTPLAQCRFVKKRFS